MLKLFKEIEGGKSHSVVSSRVNNQVHVVIASIYNKNNN